MTEMAPARAGNDLIKTRRKYVHVGSDRSRDAAPEPPGTDLRRVLIGETPTPAVSQY